MRFDNVSRTHFLTRSSEDYDAEKLHRSRLLLSSEMYWEITMFPNVSSSGHSISFQPTGIQVFGVSGNTHPCAECASTTAPR